MNGVHDLGGMEGFGPIDPEPHEPVFHARWEARVLALNLSLGAWGRWNIDASRHSRERIPAPEQLAATYFEKWLRGLTTLVVEKELATEDEIQSGSPALAGPKQTPPLAAAKVSGALAGGRPTLRDVAAAPAFALGNAVRTRNMHPPGHTRLPRYARGKLGTVERHHGAHVLPDSNAHFQGESPQHLYSVRIEARELWGEQVTGRAAVYLDLWESYLEPA